MSEDQSHPAGPARAGSAEPTAEPVAGERPAARWLGRRDRDLVLYVMQSAEPSGAEHGQLPVLRADADPLVACPPGSATARLMEREGIPVVALPFRPLRHSGGALETARSVVRGLASARELRRLLKRQPERSILYCASVRSALLAAVGAPGLGRRTVWRLTDFLPAPWWQGARAVAWLTAARVVASSAWLAREFVGRSQRLRARSRVIHPGADPVAVEGPGHDKSGRRAALVGHISPTKRTELAVDIARRVGEVEPDFELLVFGRAQYRDEDFALEEELRRRIERDPALSRHVTLCGHVPDVAAALRGVDLLLHCRPDEPFGIAVVEAMAAGLSVVAPRSGGPAETVEDGKTGLLYEPGDADDAARQVLALIRDPGRAREMGEAGREAVTRRFSTSVQVEATDALLAEIDRGRGRSIHSPSKARSMLAPRTRPGGAGAPRVLVLTPDYPPAMGGVQLTAHRVFARPERLITRIVTLHSPGDSSFDRSEAADVRRAGSSVGSRPPAIAALSARALWEALMFRPQVLVSLYVVTAPVSFALSRLLRIPVVQYVHAEEFAQRPTLSARAVRVANAVIAVSEHSRRMAVAAGAPAQRVHLVWPGVDLPAAPTATRDERPTLLTVAALRHRYKGHDLVIRALPLIYSSVPDIRWVVVGDGPLRAELEALARGEGVDDLVHFAGAVSDRERDEWLDRAWVFTIPSRPRPSGLGGEGFGIAYLEAAAHGLPVVAGDRGGATDAVIDGETGVLVDPTDREALAEVIVELLLEPERAQAMGAAAAERAREFQWTGVRARVEDLLIGLVDGAPRWELKP